MSEIEEEIIGSQSEETSQEEGASMDDVYEAFGIEKPASKEQENGEEAAPAKEQTPEPRMIKVKHNKEEIEVDVSDDKLPEYVQKSLALDKERERREKNEQLLQEAATLLGLESLDEATIQRVRQERVQQQQKQDQDQYNQLRASLRQEAEDAGLDPDKLEAYLDNHPLMKEAAKAKEDGERLSLEREMQQKNQENISKWQALYQKYPDLAEDSKAIERGETPQFMTAEMQSRIGRGYDPIDAYELAHRDKLQTQTKRATEQKLIKEQHLGLRSKVETTTTPDNEPQVPDDLANAFAAFGLPASAAKKYVK